jgi:hypothetical protein
MRLLDDDAAFPQWAFLVGGLAIVGRSIMRGVPEIQISMVVATPFIVTTVLPGHLMGPLWSACGALTIVLSLGSRNAAHPRQRSWLFGALVAGIAALLVLALQTLR